MTIRTNASTTLDTPPIPVQVKLAAAWTSFTFMYVYVDILNFYKPGVIDDILGGIVFAFQISPALLTVFLVSVSIPSVMPVLSLMLPARVNRVVNVVIAPILIPYSLFNAAGASWEWAGFYGISIGIEVLLLVYILRVAWTWPRTSLVPASSAEMVRQA